MAGYQRNVGMLMLIANVLLPLTEAQWPYQYPSQTHNWRQKLPQYTYPSPDRSYQTSYNPLNQPVKSHESVQSSSKFPIQRHQTPYYSHQQLKLNPASHSTQQPVSSWQPTKHPTKQPAALQRHVHHLTSKPLASQEPIHNTTRWPVESQRPAYDPSEEHGWQRQHAHHPFQQLTRSQQSINHSTTQHVTSQQPIHHSTQPPIRSQHHHTSQKHTQQSSLQPIRSQQPTHHSSHQPIISQQHRHYLSQQLLMSQQHTNYPSKQPTRSQQAKNYPTQQPIWSQQPTHHLNQQPVMSQQPTRHLTQQSIRSQQSTYHTNQQPIQLRKPVHHANQQPIKSHQAHLTQKPQYHRAQLPDRRHQSAWYWHHYGNRYHQQWPQSTQAPSRPGHGNERFDSGQVLLPQPNKSITNSTFSPSFPNNTETFTTGRTPFTNATIVFTNSMTTTEKTISTTNLSTISSTPLTTIIGISSATLPTESKPGTTAPTFGITSASPSRTERTKIRTKMAITSFLPINQTTTSKQEVSDNSTVDDLKNAFTTYVATVTSPTVTDTSTTTKTSPSWPFTMKPVQLIVKTQKYAEVSSPTTNNTEDLSYYMNGNLDGKLEEKSLEEFLNPANGQVSDSVSQKVCCESKYLKHPLADKSHNVTELTDITTLSPLKFEEYGSDISDDIPQHNHDLLHHDNTATRQYPTEKALTLMPNDNNTTHLHNATDITLLLPSLSVSPHGEYSTSPPSSKGGDKSLFSKNNVTFSQSLTKSDNLLPSKLLTNDTSTSPAKETNPPPQQSYLSSHMTWMGYVHPNPTRAVMVTFEPQTARYPSMSSSPLELPKEIKYPYQKDGQKEAIILPAGNQAFPKKAQEHTTHPQHKSHGPHRLPVQQTSPPHLLDPGFPRNQHLNHPSSSNNHPMQRKSSQGILPQFNPAKDLRFELTKLRETAAESNTKDVLPQFNPTSGLIFPLKESNNGGNTESSDSEGEIDNASKDLQLDPFHTVPGPSLRKHLVNESHYSDVIKETGRIHNKNLHEEPIRLFSGYESNITSWKNEASTLKTPNEQLSFKMEENTTTPMPLLNISNTVPITVSQIKTPQANASSSTIPPIMSASSVHTTPSEIDESAQKAIKTSTSLTDGYENIHDKPFPLFAGFLWTNTELMTELENQSSNIQPHANGKNENSHDSHTLPQAIKGIMKPVLLDATNTTNIEDEQRMKLGNTSTKLIPPQNMEKVEENIKVVLPYMPLFHSVVPSQKRFSSLDERKYIITGANNAAEATVTSKTNSQQQILLKPLYPQGLAHGLRHKPVLLQSIPPDQQPWRPIHDKPLELPDLMAPTRPLSSKKPTSEVSFTPSEAETLEFLPLTQRSQNLPQSQGLSGFPPAPEFTTEPPRLQDLPPPAQSHEFPLPPIIQGQPLPTKQQDVSLPLKQQKFPHPTKSQYLQSQRHTNSPSPTRKQVLPLSKQSQYLFSTRGPLHLSPRPQTIRSALYSSLQNSSPPSTLVNETLGKQSQLLLQGHLPIQIKEKSPSSQGHNPTRIKEKSPPHNLESSPRDHKLQQPSQHKLFDTPSTTGQVHEPTIAAGTRYIQPESRGETLQNTHQFTSDKFSITEPYKEPFLSTPASHSSTFWPEASQPTLTPIFHRPSLFASQIPYQSESLDYLFVKQSDKREIPDVQSTVSVSITPYATSTPMTIQEASELQLSSINRNNERLVNDFLNALPNPFKGSVKVDRANLHNHNNVAFSNSYGNVIYQHGGITFIGEENNSDE